MEYDAEWDRYEGTSLTVTGPVFAQVLLACLRTGRDAESYASGTAG
jgi:hypothetical protein